MTRLEWQEARYALQAGQMDTAHKEFIQLINQLGEVDDAGELRKLNLLLRQCEDHFVEEQLWIERSQMLGAENHLRDHETVLTLLRTAREHVQAGVSGAGREIAEPLAAWFDRHATTLDAALAFQMQQHALCVRARPGIPAVG